MKPKLVRKLFWYLLCIGFVIGMAGAYLSTVFVVMGGVLMIFAIVLYIIFYRCPHCGQYLGRNTDDFCPYCGKEID